MIYTVKIEQTFAYPKRMKYIARTDSFIERTATVFRMSGMSVSLTKKRSHDM